MKRIWSMTLLLLAIAGIASAQNPADVLDKAVAKINKAKNIECRFSVKGPEGSTNGTLATSGRNFKITTPQSSVWYDGTHMWTSNPRTKEITLVKPTDKEVRETNPFSYLDSYKSQYRIFFSRRKDDNRYLVLLNPKTKDSDVMAVEIAINKKTYLPERFIIRDNNNQVTTITVPSLQFKSAAGKGDFACPVDQMSDYELVDLR